jgi:YVTN family beta-propeller protein
MNKKGFNWELLSVFCLGLGLGLASSVAAAEGTKQQSIEREGVKIEFNAIAVSGDELKEGGIAEIEFKISDIASGEPLSGRYPGVWMDVGETANGERLENLECKDRVGIYLQGIIGMRPLIDLNSYFVLAMNQDPSIDVIDPILGSTGANLYTRIVLGAPGADWVQTNNNKWLYVSLPRVGKVAFIDTDNFKVSTNVAAGEKPIRIALQPDESYVWVGNDARESQKSGVTVIDLAAKSSKTFIQTGQGHHEIAFSGDSRYAFVSNRNDGTVSLIDVAKLELVRQYQTGPKPLSLAYSKLARVLYVSDGQSGEISVIDPEKSEVVKRLKAAPGLGPVRVSPDGRWGMVVNPTTNRVYVIDTASNEFVHDIPIEGRPYHIAFSENFAYIRSLDTERVSLIGIQHLGGKGKVPVNNFQAGTRAPSKVPDLSLASQFAKAPGEAAMMVVSPADASVYYYMEGMNAPMGAFLNNGQRPRAVMTVDRTVKEKTPGLYGATVKLPTAGIYDVAFLLDSPRVLHCFTVNVAENPELRAGIPENKIDYLVKERKLKVGANHSIRFRLTDPRSQKPIGDLNDLTVLYYRAPGQDRTVVGAKEIGDGVYEALFTPSRVGAYYLFVSSKERKIAYTTLHYLTLVGVR